MALRAVIFDIGDVLEHNPRTGWQRQWAHRLHISGYAFDRRLAPIWRPADTGAVSAEEVERRTAAEFGLDHATLRRLMEDAWAEYVGSPNQPLIDYFAALRPRVRTGILSNSRSGAREREAHYGFADMCDALVYSHEVGLLKPDPAIYRLICAELGVAPAEALFLDDKAENVAGAEAVGMVSVRFTSTERAIAEIDGQLRRS